MSIEQSPPNENQRNESSHRSSTDDMIDSITKNAPVNQSADPLKIGKTLEILNMERELLNQRKYRDMYRNLLSQNSGALGELNTKEDVELYQDEVALLRKALASDRNSFLVGIVAGLGTWVSLRYAPRFLIARFGGAEKLQKLLEADELAKKHNTHWAQMAFTTFVEGSFSFWIGIRTYQTAAQVSDNSFEVISQIPLVQGRSLVSDTMCSDWVHITTNEIPPAFWDNLDHPDSKLQEPRTWHAIRSFSQNCIRRKEYEQVVAKNQDGDVTLPNPVPEVSWTSDHQLLTSDHAEQLVSDRK